MLMLFLVMTTDVERFNERFHKFKKVKAIIVH